jgi:hypothetical protein
MKTEISTSFFAHWLMRDGATCQQHIDAGTRMIELEAQRDEALAEVERLKAALTQSNKTITDVAKAGNLLNKADELLLRECFEVIDFNYESVSIHAKLKERLGI